MASPSIATSLGTTFHALIYSGKAISYNSCFNPPLSLDSSQNYTMINRLYQSSHFNQQNLFTWIHYSSNTHTEIGVSSIMKPYEFSWLMKHASNCSDLILYMENRKPNVTHNITNKVTLNIGNNTNISMPQTYDPDNDTVTINITSNCSSGLLEINNIGNKTTIILTPTNNVTHPGNY